MKNEIDEYISTFPKEIQTKLEQIRKTIKDAAPEAEEVIKYAMPTFVLNGNLVHFAAFKNHIGFYPVPSGIEEFKKELSAYKTAKGSAQFPLDQPIPLDLITEIVKFRVKENVDKVLKKKLTKTCKNGHNYQKNSKISICPLCEQEQKSDVNFLDLLSAPARRALQNNNITNSEQLAKFTEKEILEFHGMGKGSIPKLREVLSAQGMEFKKKIKN